MRIAAAIAPVLILAGCAAERDPAELFGPSEAGTLVVDAALIVDQPFPAIFFTVTTDPDRPFRLDNHAAVATEMHIEWNTGSGIMRLPYAPDGIVPGRHLPTIAILVEPGTTYRFHAAADDGRIVTAETRSPPRIGESAWIVIEQDGETVRQVMRTYEEFGEDVYFQPENQTIYTSGLLEMHFDRPDVVAFQVGIFSLDPGSDFVVDPDFFDPEDFEDLERTQASPPFDAPDGFLRLPWLAIYFEGRHKLKAFAVDRNWYDLVRSDPEVGGGFGGNAGDSFERPIFNVEGGIGLFGSASVDSIGFYVHPRP